MKVLRAASQILAVTVLLSSGAAADQYPGSPYGSPYSSGSRLGPVPGTPQGTGNPGQLWGSYTSTPNGVSRLPQASSPIRTASNWGQPAVGSGVSGPAPNGASYAPNGAPAPAAMPAGVVGNGYGAPMEGGYCGEPCAADCCEPCCDVPCCPPKMCPCWFGGVYGLFMDRGCSGTRYMLYDMATPSSQYMNVNDDFDTAPGIEARLGKTFCNCCWGLEAVYWGLFPDETDSRFVTADQPPPTVRSTINYGDVWLNQDDGMGGLVGVNAAATYDDAIQYFRVQRDFEYHNVEINLLSGPLFSACCGGGCGCNTGYPCAAGACGPGGYYGNGCGPSFACGTTCDSCWQTPPGACFCGPRLQVGWLFGVRWFNINEDLYLAYDNADTSLTGDPNSEFYHDVEVENHLVGVQLGLNMDYYLTNCFHLEAGTKFGFFGNDASVYQRVYNSAGAAYVDPADPQFLTLRDSESDVSFLGELRAGVGYKIGCHWRLVGGYRVVAASCVALPDAQLPYARTFANVDHLRAVDNSGSLVLHGAYYGIEFAW